jgi:hypothetical protein
MVAYVVRALADTRAEEGQAFAEYSFIVALVLAVCLLALAAIGALLPGYINDLLSALP